MIIRVLNERQYNVPDAELGRLNSLDARLQTAVEAGDQSAFDRAFTDLLDAVRTAGSPVPDETLTTSDLVLPEQGTSLAEVGALLGDEGLIPD
jgi:PspA-Associated protein